MHKSILKLLGAVAAVLLSATVSAVGMGGINVVSGLGQPLKADIELVAISKADKSSLVARLASPEAYKNAGLEYPFGNKFKFQIESRADGEAYLTVSSAQPINDPFVTMLVELTWASGKLLREYTFLLDPVGYVPQQPVQTAVQPVTPAVPAVIVAVTPAASDAPAETAAVPEVSAVSGEAPVVPTGTPFVPTETTAVPTEAAAEPGAVEPTGVEPTGVDSVAENVVTGNIASVPEAQEWLEVKRGDTMAKIAAQYKSPYISLERMLVALYRVNVHVFDAKNMNRIKAGKVVQLPTQADIEKVTQPDAKREIRAQAADWNVYRQKLASAAAVSREAQPAQQVASGKISSTVADNAPVAKESAKEVLKLSKGEAPGDYATPGAGSASDKAATGLDKKNIEQEEAIATAKAAKEEQMRTAMLEKNLQDMQRLAQLKAEVAAAAAQPPIEAASKVAVSAPVMPVPDAASAPAAVSAVAAVAQPKPAAPEPSLLDQVLSEPLYLAGGAAALLVAGGLIVMVRRRKNNSGFDQVAENNSGQTATDIGSTSGRMTAPIMPSPDTGDFTRKSTVKVAEAPHDDGVDPISEADLFLNFGRDAQAEEILKEALKSMPNNHQIHLKLLGIYSNRKDANSFATIARMLKDAGDDVAWQEAVSMGQALEPSNPLYGGADNNASAAQQTTAFNAQPAASHPVFDLDLGALSGKAAASPEQDFLGNADKTMIMSAGDMAALQQPTSMDFDVTAGSLAASGAEGAAAPDLGKLIFDVTGSHAAIPATQPEVSKPAPADDGAMEFTLDFPVAEKPAPMPQAAATSLAGISLDFDDTPAPGGSPSGEKGDHWQEVATKLDLAKAYQEMGDADGVREILAEVLNEGDAEQQEAAKSMLKQIG